MIRLSKDEITSRIKLAELKKAAEILGCTLEAHGTDIVITRKPALTVPAETMAVQGE